MTIRPPRQQLPIVAILNNAVIIYREHQQCLDNIHVRSFSITAARQLRILTVFPSLPRLNQHSENASVVLLLCLVLFVISHENLEPLIF